MAELENGEEVPSSKDNQPLDLSLVGKQVNVILGIIEKISAVAKKLVDSLPSAKEVVAQLANEQQAMDEITEDLSKNMDPQDQVEISRLKTEFQNCATKAKAFLYACQSMAKYGVSDKIINIIDRELDQGNLSSLNSFIKDMLTKLKLCSLRFKEFNAKHMEVRQKADSIMSKYKALASTASQQGQSAVMSTRTKTVASYIAYAVGLSSAVGLVTSITLGFTGCVSQEKAIGSGIVCGAGLLGSSVVGVCLSGFKINAKDKAIRCSVDARKLAKGEQCIAELSRTLDTITSKVNEVEALTTQAGEELDELKPFVWTLQKDGSKLEDYQKEKIKTQLSSFRDELGAILDITGQHGEKISTEPMELLKESNTPVYQASDD